MQRDAIPLPVAHETALSAFQIDQLSLQMGHKTILQSVNTVIPRGSLCVLIGPNGAGKSTLLRHLAGLLPPQQGEVMYHGQPVTQLKARQRAQQIAWVGQHPPSDCSLSIEDFVMLGRRPHLGRFALPKADDRQRVQQALQALELTALARQRYQQASGGERQRAVIAQALAQDTPTLLLDEPTNHLDLRHRQILMQRLFALTARGKTVVAVLHDLELAAKYADWLVLLHQGRVLRAGPPACVLDSEALSIAYDWPIRVVQESHGWRFDVLHEVNHVKASA